MKNLILASLVALLAVSAAYGQIESLRVTIPFKFFVENKALPAGEYRLGVEPISKRFVITLADGSDTMFLMPFIAHRRGGVPANSMLVFHKYENNYFLRNVWTAGHSQGWEWAQSKSERQLAKAVPQRELAFIKAAAK